MLFVVICLVVLGTIAATSWRMLRGLASVLVLWLALAICCSVCVDWLVAVRLLIVLVFYAVSFGDLRWFAVV